ncbi:MAG: hypothetical protein MI892_18600, partial [Desulfobacterales bacterium]|nr:hypothetical protein [Desulfobacterales bacterium]
MKKKLILLIALFFPIVTAIAQAPAGFKYQAVIRDASGNVLANELVTVDVAILQGSEEGPEVFSEVHDTITNSFGLVNLNIGFSNPTDFAVINWSSVSHYIRISVNGEMMGTSQLLSVPYAIYAGSSGSGNGSSGTDNDPDPSNELQDISLSDTELSISEGSTVDLKPLLVKYDNQKLSVNGHILSIEGGNSVTLPDQVNDADSDPDNEIQDI